MKGLTIKDLVARSREYHGSMNCICINSYFTADNDVRVANYMCAIGCNVEKPRELQAFSVANIAYRINNLAESSVLDEIDDDRLRAILSEDLIAHASVLQCIHYSSDTTADYIKALDRWEALDFVLLSKDELSKVLNQKL